MQIIICDICESRDNVKTYEFKIDTLEGIVNEKYDLCDKCALWLYQTLFSQLLERKIPGLTREKMDKIMVDAINARKKLGNMG